MTLAYAGFSKGEPENLRIIKSNNKKSSFRISPFFYPNLDKDQKKERSSPTSSPFLCTDFLPKFQRGGYDSILRTILTYALLAPQKRGAMAPCPPSKYAPDS